MVCAFLDITGFRSWTYRAATSHEMKEEFIGNFYRALQCYVRAHRDVWAKYEGDGIIVVHEFTPAERKDGKSIRDFLLGLRCLFRKAQRSLRESEGPPEGVRMRWISGYVYKLMVLDPNDPNRDRLIPEYLEYCTNSVRGLLEVNPEHSCVATKGLVKGAGKRRPIFRVRPLGTPSCYPKGVNKEDVDGLEIVRL